ncbi:hypothetical protein [Duganella levis]|uniref:Uncharacterized protein n=1 Tax=Duganella levis TaxID=2692169 RepID=A0ABW9VXU3_9BURK|nr:hypothetical protein [Duganella levis]MYN26479.1 hypothetical protein [Duganella levis]
MIRRIAIAFVFSLGFTASYAMANDAVVDDLSPTMRCLVDCLNAGARLNFCVPVCVE